ncbi:MAG TPA: metallophosphoesterase [Polyangiaceae bacterium]|nr:metallophosphoesterase [Polyangiaceae bacterium]
MSVIGFVVFLVLLLTALGGINLHVFRWARNAFGLGRAGQVILKSVLWAAVAGMILGRVAGRFWPGAPSTPLIAVASTVELAVIISFAFLLVADVGLLLLDLPARVRRLRTRDAAPVTSPAAPAAELATASAPALTVPRRAFMMQAAAGSAFLIGGTSSLYGALKGRSDYVIEEIALKLPGLGRGFDGFSIVQLSDIHIGAFTGQAELNIAEELVRKARPDLVVLTGDLLDNDSRLAPDLGRFVRRLGPLARHGVVAITGNHDYFAGDEEMAGAITGGGGRILRNEGLVIGSAGAGIALLGVDDVWARRQGLGGPDLLRAVAALPQIEGRVAPARDLPRVLLCHNPSYFAESAGKVALQLSGHTHGGQINLGLRPADYLLPGGWVAGRYDQNGSVLYVNRGFGTVGPPARLQAPPEVTRIVLSA